MTTITKAQLEVLYKNAPAGISKEDLQAGYIDKGYEIEGVDTAAAKAYNAQKRAGFPAPIEAQTPETIQETPEKPGVLGTIGNVVKDVADTLVVKPALRAGQAVGGLVSQAVINSMDDTDPNKAIYQANLDKSLSEKTDVPVFGDIEAQKGFGEGGGKQIAGETLKVGSYLFPYGKVAGAVGGGILGTASKLTPAAVKTAKVAGNVVSGATGGYMADVGYGLGDESKTLGEAFTPGLGTALGVAIPLAGPAVRALKGAPKSASDVTRRVIQGSTKDIPLAEQAFKNIDTTGITTRKELSDRLGTAMENQMNVVDAELGKSTQTIPMKDLVIKAKNNAGQEVKTNVVSNALDHLKQFYADAGDAVSASNVGLIKTKAMTEGLTHQEVNNIARMYSEEFGKKAFNKMGDPLTNVNAQMFENTRTGLKSIARSGITGKEAAAADRLYSAMSNTKRLVDKGVEAVSKLEGRIKNRNLFEKLSYGASKLINTMTGGGLKAGIEALGVSNIGNKVDNWINLENSLSKDLKFIEKANGIVDENKLIKFIEDYAKKLKFPGDVLVDDLGASAGKSLKGKGAIPKNSLHERLIAKNVPLKQYTKEHIDQIEKQILGDKSKAVVIDADTIKKMHPKFNPKNPGALHEESSAISKELVEKAIDEDVSGIFKMIGGGSGSGKSEVVLLKIGNQPGVVFDGTLGGLDSAVKKIEYALSKGKKIELHPVYTPPKLATLFNQMRARSVADDVLIDSHFGMRDNIPALYDKFGKKVKVIPYQNRVFDASREYQGELIDPKKVKGFLNGMKMSKQEVADEVNFINAHIKEYGIDFTKSIINDIL